MQGNESIAVAPAEATLAHDQFGGLVRVHGQQLQAGALLFQPQPVAAAQVALAHPQRIAIAIEVTAADAGVVEAVQGRVHQSIGAAFPATGQGRQLLQHQEGPVAAAHRLGQHGKAAVVERLAAEQTGGEDLGKQADTGARR